MTRNSTATLAKKTKTQAISSRENPSSAIKGEGFFSFRSCSSAVSYCSSLPSLNRKRCFFILSAVRFFSNYMGKGRDAYLGRVFLEKFIKMKGYTEDFKNLIDKGFLVRKRKGRAGVCTSAFAIGPALAFEDWFEMDFKEADPTGRIDSWQRFVEHVKQSPAYSGIAEEEKRLAEAQAADVRKLEVVEDEDFVPTIAIEADKVMAKAKNKYKRVIKNIRRANKAAEKTGRAIIPEPAFKMTMAYCREIVTERINSIKNKNWQASIHSRSHGKGTGRIFTNATNCPKAFRKFWRIEGEKTVNVDIRCAQPSLFALFYKNETPEEIAEKAKFIENITDKDFYEEMAADSGATLTRNKAKTKIFSFAFGRNHHQNTRIGRAFLSSYPILHKRMSDLKAEFGYKECAYQMQIAEVDAVIYGAFAELSKRGITAITIHDSITCKESEAEAVKDALERNFEAKMGFRPVVRIESYTA